MISAPPADGTGYPGWPVGCLNQDYFTLEQHGHVGMLGYAPEMLRYVKIL